MRLSPLRVGCLVPTVSLPNLCRRFGVSSELIATLLSTVSRRVVVVDRERERENDNVINGTVLQFSLLHLLV